jgi:hypothetical protein
MQLDLSITMSGYEHFLLNWIIPRILDVVWLLNLIRCYLESTTVFLGSYGGAW